MCDLWVGITMSRNVLLKPYFNDHQTPLLVLSQSHVHGGEILLSYVCTVLTMCCTCC